MSLSVPCPPRGLAGCRQHGAAALSALLVLAVAAGSNPVANAVSSVGSGSSSAERLVMVESAAVDLAEPAVDPQVWQGAGPAPTDPPVSVSALLLLPPVADTRVDLTGIPARVLEAYRTAADRLAVERPGCDLPWSLLAGIGRVESGHGTFGGASVTADGRIVPEIIGMRLDGAGPVALIRDSDGGAYDRDASFDRAVGPMQFIPTTWARYAADADGDGRTDPHDIDDVALAAGRYLCTAAGGSLTVPAANVRAVYAYNHSYDYVRLVLTLAAGYANMSPASLGVGLLPAPTSPVVTDALLLPPGEGGPAQPYGQPAPADGGQPGAPAPSGAGPQVQAAGPSGEGSTSPAGSTTASGSGTASPAPAQASPSPTSSPAAPAPKPSPTSSPTSSPSPTPSPSSGSGLPPVGGLPPLP